MKAKRVLWFTLALALVGLSAGACRQSETPPPPTQPPTQPPPTQPSPTGPAGEGRCGDGTCDEHEQQNPALCPEDCATTIATPTSSSDTAGPACAGEEWMLVIQGCVNMVGTEPSAHLCSIVGACITVDQSCNIQGSGTGQYQEGGGYSSPTGKCSYQVEYPDFTVSVGGEMVSDALQVRLDASQIWEQVEATCYGKTSSFPGPMMQQAYGSALRNGGGYFCQIPARDGAHADVAGKDAVVPDNLSYDFDVDLQAGCP